jgi:ribonuclease P protein subunit RPR2
MRVTESYLPILRLGALLHDIGKLRVSPAILDKTTRLTDEEWGILREHPWRGENLLLELGFDKRVCAIVGQNHERDNGTGYPLRLGRFEICLGAQIVAVADTFDAITADRSYRRGEPYEVARDEIVGWAGALFAPSVVGAFERIPQAEWELAH